MTLEGGKPPIREVVSSNLFDRFGLFFRCLDYDYGSQYKIYLDDFYVLYHHVPSQSCLQLIWRATQGKDPPVLK